MGKKKQIKKVKNKIYYVHIIFEAKLNVLKICVLRIIDGLFCLNKKGKGVYVCYNLHNFVHLFYLFL